MINLKYNVSLAKYTTYKIGGTSDFFFKPQNVFHLKQAVSWSKQQKIPYFILGFGSNILINDEGFRGIAIRLAGDFKKLIFNERDSVITSGAAVSLIKLAKECSKRGIGGFEGISDIPGSVGASVRINAGTKEGEIKDYFLSADVLDEEVNLRTIYFNEMNFGQRTSMLVGKKMIVLQASFAYGEHNRPETLIERLKKHRDERKRKQPVNKKNCGSVFKSPNERPAGWYIDQCGLKGKRIGDAMIAHEHANWIVNQGTASASDVKKLIEKVQFDVFNRFGIQLEREVIYVPEDIL
jgi:UDP-N-acetylmuramate dehydrogenase